MDTSMLLSPTGLAWNGLKGELEDLSFKYLKPAEYGTIRDTIARKKKERDAYIAGGEGPPEKKARGVWGQGGRVGKGKAGSTVSIGR